MTLSDKSGFVAAALVLSASAFANSYTIVDLGYCHCHPAAISGGGIVVASRRAAPFRGQVYRGHQWHDFQPHTVLTTINRNGDIGGYFKGGPNDGKGAIWTSDGTTLIVDPPTGGQDGKVDDINVGTNAIGTYLAGGVRRCFHWTQGGVYDIGLPSGSVDCEARAINEFAMTGNATLTTGHVHAWRYDSSFHDMGVLQGADYSEAFGMDRNEDIVGTSGSETGGAHAFWWVGNAFLIDLDPNGEYYESAALSISPNKRAYIVGYAASCLGCDTIAVRFDPLNDDVVPLLGEVANVGTWKTLKIATSVNGKGVIVGWGDNGENRDEPFMLVPQ